MKKLSLLINLILGFKTSLKKKLSKLKPKRLHDWKLWLLLIYLKIDEEIKSWYRERSERKIRKDEKEPAWEVRVEGGKKRMKGMKKKSFSLCCYGYFMAKFTVAVLIVYCIVQVSQVLLRSQSLPVQYLKRSPLSKACILQVKLKETTGQLTIINLTML